MKNLLKMALLLAVVAVGLSSCEKEETAKGTVSVEMTDATIDNANVSAAVVTVADVQIGGQSIEGFQKTTIDFMAYQNGLTAVLGQLDVEARAYNQITLVLDQAEDASGNAPGCYVQTVDGTKHALVAASNRIDVSGYIDVAENQTTTLVADFDLRKSIVASSNANDNYDFVTASELNSAVRFVQKDRTADMDGQLSNDPSNGDRLVAYAYVKGSYDRATEVQGSGASEIQFANAVSSSVVDQNGNFQLSFLEEGDYELHIASYTEDSNGNLELAGTLELSAGLGVLLNNLGLSAGADLSLSLTATAFVPL